MKLEDAAVIPDPILDMFDITDEGDVIYLGVRCLQEPMLSQFKALLVDKKEIEINKSAEARIAALRGSLT